MAEIQRQILNTKLLPKRPAKMLKSSLDYLHYQIRNNPIVPQENVDQDDIELEFQRRRKEVNFFFNIHKSTCKHI